MWNNLWFVEKLAFISIACLTLYEEASIGVEIIKQTALLALRNSLKSGKG